MSRGLVHRVLFPALIATAHLACVQPVLYKTGSATAPRRASNCAFDVIGSHPGPGYVEVAQVSVDGPDNMAATSYRDPRAFADEVHAQVCAAGGDALMTEVNGTGYVIHGIVFHRLDEPPPAAPPPAAPPPAAMCEPICSPGFACQAGTCVPQCNPACTGTDTCGNDRLCHPGR